MSRNLYSGISEVRKAGNHRLDDARALLNSVRWRGAMYIAGYAVECRLKMKLMQKFDCLNLSELEDELRRRDLLPSGATVFTHRFVPMLRVAGAFDRLRENSRSNPEIWRSFNLVNQWVEAWRYTADPASPEDAKDFISAVEVILRWIDHKV